MYFTTATLEQMTAQNRNRFTVVSKNRKAN